MQTAKANIRKTDGVVAYPTHFITDVDVWGSIEGAYDSQNRPYVVPQGVSFNPIAVGDKTAESAGYTGFKFASLPAFADQAGFVQWPTSGPVGASAAYHPLLVGALDIASYWLESTPVTRVLPQPGSATLTVLIQSFVYCAFVPVYPSALQLV